MPTFSLNQRVYLAGPYARPDPAANVNQTIIVARQVLEAGFIPFVPHLYHLWHLIEPRPENDWLKLDIEWLLACDLLLRLPGKSTGADHEVKVALTHQIPVFYSLSELKQRFPPR
jgi:nucleoside 2-deoxyribosyltransferase